MKIYLLEDNKVFRNKYKKFVKSQGYEIIVCESLEDFEYIDCDLYLIDLQLWKEYSYDVIKQLRKNTNKLIVMFTHHNDADILRRGFEAWADLFQYKMEYTLYWLHLDMYKKFCKNHNKWYNEDIFT